MNGNYCGYLVIAWHPGNGNIPLDPGLLAGGNIRKLIGVVHREKDIQDNCLSISNILKVTVQRLDVDQKIMSAAISDCTYLVGCFPMT